MEKIKDFIYETSDILLGFIVLAMIIFVFTYELKEFFSFDMIVPLSVSIESEENISSEEPVSATRPNEIAASEPIPTNQIVVDKSTESKPMTSSEITPTKDPFSASGEGIQEEPAPQTTNQIEQTQQDPQLNPTTSSVKIIIPSGSASEVIADLLYKSNLIRSQQEFLNYITSKKLDTKLKAGTFTIPGESSLEEVVKILTQ